MKRTSKGFVPSVFLILLLSISVSAQRQLEDVLDRMDSHNRSLTSLEASIHMVKYNSQIGEADPTYRGTVSYIPNRDRKKISIRLDWTTPVLETLVISNGQYRLYRPKIQQGYEGAVDKARSNSAAAGPLSFLGMTKEQLKANFSVRFIGTETVNAGRLATTKIELTPKQKADYKTAELWIDANGMPAQARIVATNNDLTTVLITNEKRNVKIDSKVFNYKFPKGTKIIKD